MKARRHERQTGYKASSLPSRQITPCVNGVYEHVKPGYILASVSGRVGVLMVAGGYLNDE